MTAAPAVPSSGHPSTGGVGRVLGGLWVLAATAFIAIIESFYVLLRADGVRIPVSLVIAALCHPLLTSAMWRATRSRPAMVAPFVVWLVIVLRLGFRRAEGDLVVTGNNWVSTVLLFGGALIFVGAVGVLMPVRGHVDRRGRADSLGGNGPS